VTHLPARISQRSRAHIPAVVPPLKHRNYLIEKHGSLLFPAPIDFDLRARA